MVAFLLPGGASAYRAYGFVGRISEAPSGFFGRWRFAYLPYKATLLRREQYSALHMVRIRELIEQRQTFNLMRLA